MPEVSPAPTHSSTHNHFDPRNLYTTPSHLDPLQKALALHMQPETNLCAMCCRLGLGPMQARQQRTSAAVSVRLTMHAWAHREEAPREVRVEAAHHLYPADLLRAARFPVQQTQSSGTY